MAEGEVKITRAERLRIPRLLDSGRIAKLRAFRTRITDWYAPALEVFDEPVIVCIEREGVERCFDHFHADVLKFEDLIAHKKTAGYVVSVKDAVLAYMLVFKRGSRHLITGFLSSKYADGIPSFPEFRDVHPETVGEALSRLKAEGWISG